MLRFKYNHVSLLLRQAILDSRAFVRDTRGVSYNPRLESQRYLGIKIINIHLNPYKPSSFLQDKVEYG
jgi:hypothetical protein